MGLNDIEFEREEFNRRFHVSAADSGFAMAWAPCIDGRVRDALFKRHTGSDGLMTMLYGAKGLVDNLPRVVRIEYGKAAS